MLRTTKKMRKRQPSQRDPMNEPARVRWRGDFWDVEFYDVVGQYVEIEGKQCLREAVDRDLFGDDGKRLVSINYKAGEMSFPAAYWWEAMQMVAETIDARRSGDGSDWVILISGFVAKDDGAPLVDDNGQALEVVAWVRESALTPFPNEDGNVEETSFVSGHSRNVIAELKASHTRKLVGYRAFHRTDDSETFGPSRPRVEVRKESKEVHPDAHDWIAAERPQRSDEVDDLRIGDARDMDEETWRFWNEFQDRPQELSAVLEGREPEIHPTGPEPTVSREKLLRELRPNRVRSAKKG